MKTSYMYTELKFRGLKKTTKKKRLSEQLFCQTNLDPPDENSWIRACMEFKFFQA